MSVCFVFFYLFILKTVAAWCGEMIPAPPPPPPPPPPGAPGSSGDSASSSARSRASKIDLITQATGLIDAIKSGEVEKIKVGKIAPVEEWFACPTGL